MRAAGGAAELCLTPDMLAALALLHYLEPNAVQIGNMMVAVPLLNHGLIMRSEIASRLSTTSTYYITKAGRSAFTRAKRAAGVL